MIANKKRFFGKTFFTEKRFLVGVWLLTRMLLPFVFLSDNMIRLITGDLRLYFDWANDFTNNNIPGVTFDWPYPAGALIPVVFPLLLTRLTSDVTVYALMFLATGWLCDAFIMWILARRGKKIGSGLRGMWWWTVFGFALGPVMWTRLDLFAGIFALAAYTTGPITAGFMIAVGAGIKVWPLFLFPVVILLSRDRIRTLLAVLVTFIAAFTVIVLTRKAVSLFSFVTFQKERGVQVEAISALPALWKGVITQTSNVFYNTTTATLEVSDAPVIDHWLILMSSTIIFFGLACAIKTFHCYPERTAIALSGTIMCCLLISNTVFSAQYVIWLAIPIAWGACLPGKIKSEEALLIAIAVLTQIVFPYGWQSVQQNETWTVILLSLKAIFLITLLGVFLWRLIKLAFSKPLSRPNTTVFAN